MNDLVVGDTDAGGISSLTVLFLDTDGTVIEEVTSTESSNFFAFSVSNIGDLNGDGLNDLAAINGDFAGNDFIEIYLMNADGTLTLLNATRWALATGQRANPRAVYSVGDYDGNGIKDLAVSSYNFDYAPTGFGIFDVSVIQLDAAGTIIGFENITPGVGGFMGTGNPFDDFYFGTAGVTVVNIGL